MFGSLLAATWYTDVAVIAVIVLFILAGAFKGFGNSLKGGFMTVLIILGSLLLVGVLHGPVMASEAGTGLNGVLSSSSEGWGDSFTKDVYYEDGTYKISNGEGTLVAISGSDGIKGKIAGWLATKFIAPEDASMEVAPENHESVADVCVYNLTSLIIALGLFLVLCIAMSIVCSILKKVTAGMHKSENKALSVLDRILGAIVGLLLGATVVFLVLAILAAFSDKAPSIVQYIDESKICKFFYELNPIGKMFEKIFTKN